MVEACLYRTDTKPDTFVKYLLVAVLLLDPLPQKAWEGAIAMERSDGESPSPLPFLAHPLTQICQQAHGHPISL